MCVNVCERMYVWLLVVFANKSDMCNSKILQLPKREYPFILALKLEVGGRVNGFLKKMMGISHA